MFGCATNKQDYIIDVVQSQVIQSSLWYSLIINTKYNTTCNQELMLFKKDLAL